MKVFLDTNVLVSAIATRGLCADVLREVLTSHQMIISAELLEELEKVLREKIGLPRALISEFVNFIRQDARVSEPTPLHRVSIKDPADVAILSAAINGGTDLFVTGDRELIDLERLEKMEIVAPREFWEKLRT
jgi:putative PIN family toxin of toxin-antitoxin system